MRIAGIAPTQPERLAMPDAKPSGLNSDPFYADGALYDVLYSSLDVDIPFYFEEAIWSDGPTLDLACGTGRIAIPIANAGVPVVGLDLSETMLAQARAKAPSQEWHLGDMRDFSLDREFALIYVAFNSFQHLHSDEDVARFCRCVKRHLLPNGRFIFDVFTPKLELLLVPPDQRRPIGQLPDPAGRGILRVEEQRTYDCTNRMVHSTWYTALDGQRDFNVTKLTFRCFFPKELLTLLAVNGFAVEKRYGDFRRKPFSDDDDKQILVCRTQEP